MAYMLIEKLDHLPSKPICQAEGYATIKICGQEEVSQEGEDALIYYKGEVFSGNLFSSIDATVVALNMFESDAAELHRRLNLVCHPCILSSLTYASGLGHKYGNYKFFAFPYFKCTFAEYMKKDYKQTMEFGRFTEEFIELIGCVVRGLLELHKRGFHCPELSGNHIAVLKEHKSVSAKLWYFSILEPDLCGGWQPLVPSPDDASR